MPKKYPVPLNFTVDGLGQVSARPAPDDISMSVVLGEEISYFDFGRCPICLDVSVQLSREHIPPESVGGDVRTLTCSRCNNLLGSRVEDEFTAWWYDHLCVARFSSPNSEVVGHRFVENIGLRYTNDGQYVLILKGGAGNEVRSMLESGNLVAEFRLPDSNRYRIAALKQAYLAACIRIRDIPTTPESDAIRAELISARDAPDNNSIPVGKNAATLRLGRATDPDDRDSASSYMRRHGRRCHHVERRSSWRIRRRILAITRSGC